MPDYPLRSDLPKAGVAMTLDWLGYLIQISAPLVPESNLPLLFLDLGSFSSV